MITSEYMFKTACIAGN